MNLPRQLIERKLSSLLGAQVTIDKLSFSLIKGVIEAAGITVAGDAPDQPLLTIRHVRAEVAVGKALQKQIAIKSLRIESPRINIYRRQDGATNLPNRKATADIADASGPHEASDEHSWNFDIERAQIFDGSFHFFKPLPERSSYHISVERISGELERQEETLTLTLLGETAGRRDEPVELGELRLRATFNGIKNIARLLDAALEVRLEIAELAKIDLRCVSLRQRQFELSASAASDLDLLLRLVR